MYRSCPLVGGSPPVLAVLGHCRPSAIMQRAALRKVAVFSYEHRESPTKLLEKSWTAVLWSWAVPLSSSNFLIFVDLVGDEDDAVTNNAVLTGLFFHNISVAGIRNQHVFLFINTGSPVCRSTTAAKRACRVH